MLTSSVLYWSYSTADVSSYYPFDARVRNWSTPAVPLQLQPPCKDIRLIEQKTLDWRKTYDDDKMCNMLACIYNKLLAPYYDRVAVLSLNLTTPHVQHM